MLTLFTTAKPFRGHHAVIQRNALQSWKLLHPGVEIILFGNDLGAAEICAEFGLRHEPSIIVNPSGTKRLDSIFGRAQQIPRHDLLCYCNCDIILTQEFRRALERICEWSKLFLMVGRRWDTDVTAPLDFSARDWEAKIIQLAQSEGILRGYQYIDYFAFPRHLYPEFPPLVIGRVGWDPWLVRRASELGAAVVDVSKVVCAIHQNHDYGYHPQGVSGVWHDEEAARNIKFAGGPGRLGTIEDARFRLTERGIQPNRWWWLANTKRTLRVTRNWVTGTYRTWILFPVLNLTRPMRHAIGLKENNVVPAFWRRWRGKRHSMDQ